ncbi:MAG TPA: thiamine pyrophosphate-dependent enzyme [Chloroflexota bacterium]|nr:thiamine pyrophosphate-dependent enzyme [Chloroflexota bacterium]
MRSLEAVQLLRERLGDALVVSSLGTPSYLVHASGDRPLNFYLWAAMGMASSTGLGLAMAQPDRRVVVVDGDGAAVMNLGGMVTVATRCPTNLLWVILENGAFLETGGQQIATHGPADLVTIAQGCGIRQAERAADPDTLVRLLDDGLTRPGPTLVVARVDRDTVRDLPPVDPVRVKNRFMDALGS